MIYTLQPVKEGEPRAMVCPHCAAYLMLLDAAECTSQNGDYWLQDGDSVPGVIDQLPGGYARGHLAELMVGTCSSCRGSYWVAEATLTNQDWAWLEAFIAGDPPFDQPGHARNYFGTWRGVNWWLTEQKAPAGIVHQHCFGPFPLADGELRGPMGVAACGELAKKPAWGEARTFLLDVWPTLAARHAAAQTEHASA